MARQAMKQGQGSTQKMSHAGHMQSAMPGMDECIDLCLECHKVCLREAMQHCLEVGGEHVAPEHFRLMITCAQICQTSTDFMLAGSMQHQQVCSVCATLCEQCAQSCRQLDGMEMCAETCERCAESCRQMAGDGGKDNMSGRMVENAPRSAGL